MCLLFLFYRSYHHYHTLAFELGHLLGLAETVQIDCETQEQLLALLREEDRTATEKYVSLDFRSLLEEALGVIELELVVVLISLGPEANLLDNNLGSVGFLLLRFLFLLIDVLLVINNLAHRRLGGRYYLDQVELECLSHLECFCKRIDVLLGNIVSYHPYPGGGNLAVQARSFFFLAVLRQALIRKTGC